MPEEEPKIYGDLAPEEVTAAKERFGQRREFGAETIPDEERKNEQDLEVITFINQCLTQEMKDAGLENNNILAPERLHFFSDDGYKQNFPGEKAPGVYYSHENAACFNTDEVKRPHLYRLILHEQIHALAYHSVGVVRQPDGEAGTAFLRGGVNMVNPHEASHEHFRDVNEILINWVELYILDKYSKEFKERFDFGLKELGIEREPGILNISDGMALMDLIFKRVAEQKGESLDRVRVRFIRSLFSGEISYFKDIEKTFGRGSLRLLAALGSSGGVDKEKRKEEAKKALKYFESKNQKERDKITSEILNERERFRYRQRRETEKRENSLLVRTKKVIRRGLKGKK